MTKVATVRHVLAAESAPLSASTAAPFAITFRGGVERMSRSREDVARDLADWHFKVEPTLAQIYWLNPGASADAPIHLLEVSGSKEAAPAFQVEPGTVGAIEFSSTADVPYRSVVAEVTKAELLLLQHGLLSLPAGWNLDLKNAVPFVPQGASGANDT